MNKYLKASPWHVLVNLLIAYVCYEACRLAFLFENWSFYSATMTWANFWQLSRGGLLFDTAAICFTNSLYLVLALWPFWQQNRVYRTVTKWAFVLPNTVAVVICLMDSVYFGFTQQRVTANVFTEFQNENNLGRIFGVELLSHWYFLLLAVVLVALLYKGYRTAKVVNRITHAVWLLIMVPLAIAGMRGATFRTATRPISMNDAYRYADKPADTYVVLNTPFSLIKTFGHKGIATPRFFDSQAELDSIYSPVHYPVEGAVPQKKNVVILIVESFAEEFIGSRNRHLDGGKYLGYTPFADSLLAQSLTWEHTFCNSWTSIDAMPAVLASIPQMFDPFVLSPFSVNKINSLATELGKWGYQTAFFHGAENQSMGFHAFSQAAGYQHYYGREEYYADKRFGGKNDFDGTWGIWDEPFLQYFCTKMTDMKQPFLTTVFTLSSHHPYAIPEKYKNVFKDEGIHKLHKCIRYTDHALRRFFESAAKQPWYKNTIFVLSADHASSKTTHAEYKTEVGDYRIPILFFDPSGQLPRECRKGVAQQIDIMPTLLGHLGYDRPYIAFGIDLLNTPAEKTWAFNWHQWPQFIQGNYSLITDGQHVTGFYDYVGDPLLKHNLKDKGLPQQDSMERQLQAFIQCYMQRMKANDVTMDNQKKENKQ